MSGVVAVGSPRSSCFDLGDPVVVFSVRMEEGSLVWMIPKMLFSLLSIKPDFYFVSHQYIGLCFIMLCVCVGGGGVIVCVFCFL